METEGHMREKCYPQATLLTRDVEIDQTRKFYARSVFHGTGRFARSFENGDKSKPTGEIWDVLKGILTNGILPQYDDFNRFILPGAKTVSLTQQRMYASCFAGLFGGDADLVYRYGSTNEWLRAYILTINAEVFKPANILSVTSTMLKNLAQQRSLKEVSASLNLPAQVQRWVSNKAPQVTNNHPIIIGVQPNKVKPIRIFKGMDQYEIRTTDTILPEHLSFIEVPLNRVNETRDLVDKVGLPNLAVLPMELGEVTAWIDGYKHCMAPKEFQL